MPNKVTVAEPRSKLANRASGEHTNSYLKMKTKPWKTAPISPTCEKFRAGVFLCKEEMSKDGMCDAPTSFAYPAMGGGWYALCFKHGHKHLPQIETIEALIAKGERFE